MELSQKTKKMDTLREEDEDTYLDVKSSCISSSGVSDFDEPCEVSRKLKIPALDKYNLRTKSIQNRIEIETKRKQAPRRKEPKPKQRPAPLSKYRRKTANLRERSRMQVRVDALARSSR